MNRSNGNIEINSLNTEINIYPDNNIARLTYHGLVPWPNPIDSHTVKCCDSALLHSLAGNGSLSNLQRYSINDLMAVLIDMAHNRSCIFETYDDGFNAIIDLSVLPS